jgi:hypothetical protein
MKELILESRLYFELNRRANDNQSLARELRGLIDSSLTSFEEILADIRRYFYTYTDHALTHSGRVVTNMSRLLTKPQIEELTSVELYLLIASALVHDIGMVVSERDVENLIASDEYCNEKTAICNCLGIDPATADNGYGLFRMVVAEHIRKRHGKRCSFVLHEGLLGCSRLTGGNDELTRKLAVVCIGHTLTREEILSSGNYPTCVQVRNQDVNVLFCTILLRVGDLLDITTARASPVIRELSEPLEPLSASHWDQYTKIELGGLKPKRPIHIGGTCSTQSAERLLREWVRWLEDECEWAVLTLNTSEEQHYLHLGRVTYDVKPAINKEGRPLYEFHNYRFNLDEEEVFRKLFGRRLYGRPDAALRELLQNAIDATRVRAVLTCSADPKWTTFTEVEKRQKYLAHLDANADKFALRSEISEVINTKTGRTDIWLTITDAGVGMSREVIEKYLLKVGRSRWRDDPRTRSLGIGTIGEFGIGFISAFMISDQIVIETQSCLPNDEGIQAVIYNWKGYLATEPISRTTPGTSVRLLLKPEAAESLRDLIASISHWCPFPEVPIDIQAFGGEIHRIPVRGRKGYSSEEKRIYFRIGVGYSLASITEKSAPLTTSLPPTLAQEGIAIPDVPPPIKDIPEQRILRERGLRVNLFGTETTRLDMSRNITEGGYEQLWDKFVPVIWGGLARYSLRTKAGGKAFAELVQTQFEWSLGSSAFLLLQEQELWYGNISGLPLVETLSFVDYRRPFIEKTGENMENIIVLPEPPLPLMLGLDVDDEINETVDDRSKYWAQLAGHIPRGERPKTYTDVDAPWDNKYDLDDLELDDYEDSTPPSLFTFKQYYQVIFQRYHFVSQSRSGNAQLHVTKPSDRIALRLDQLVLFRLTESWWAIRSPKSGNWFIASSTDFELAEDGIPAAMRDSLSYEQYATTLLYDLWPATSNWTFLNLSTLGKAIDRAYYDINEASIGDNPYDDDYNEEDNELDDDDDDDDFEILVDLTPSERRRAGRHDVDSDDSNSIISNFVKNVLTRIDSSSLEMRLTEWDRKSWRQKRNKSKQQ